MNISDYLNPSIVKHFKFMGITSIEEVARMSDTELLKIRGFGLLALQKLRSKFPFVERVDPVIPIRQWCPMCNQVHRIGFWVPNEIWNEAIHPYFQNDTVCLHCFTARADEKFLPWDQDIKFYPTSFYTQRELQIKVANEQAQ